MKRLIRKARHDTLNREFAIVYADGKFYEDITHAACCKQILKDFDFADVKLESNIVRPDFNTFEKMSHTIDELVFGHHAEKDNGIFIIYGFINGQYCEFDALPSHIIKEFEEHYNLPVEDELKHENNTNYNDMEEELNDKAHERVKELEEEDSQDALIVLEKNGYSPYLQVDDDTIYVNQSQTSVIVFDGRRFDVYNLGEKRQKMEPIELVNYSFGTYKSDTLRKLESYGATIEIDQNSIADGKCDFLVNFTNLNNLNINLTINGDRIIVNLDNSDITEEDYEYLLDGESPSKGMHADSLDLLNQLGGEQEDGDHRRMNDVTDEEVDDFLNTLYK